MDYELIDDSTKNTLRLQMLAAAEADHWRLTLGLETLRAVMEEGDPAIEEAEEQVAFMERKISALRSLGDADAT